MSIPAAWALAAMSLLVGVQGHAYSFGDLALISPTMGANAGRVCIGDSDPDIGCPTNSPYLTSGGLLGIGTANPQTALEVSGTVSATYFVGDGSGLTGITAATSDRITSGTTSMVAVSVTGYVSLTQAGSNTGWFNPTRGLVTLGVSATGGISGTTGYFSGNPNIGPVGAENYAPLRVYSANTFGASFMGTVNGPTGVVHLGNTNISTSWNLGIETGSGWGLAPSGSLYIDENNIGPRVTFAPGGNVGIGTMQPIRNLHIVGQTNTSTEFLMEQRGAKPNWSKWNFVVDGGNGTTASNFYIRILNDLGNGTTILPFYIKGTTGNVGIGTVAPAATLQVSGSFIVNTTGQTTTPSLYVSTTGAIGLGTNAPTEQLTLKGNGPNIGLLDTTSGATDTIQNSAGGLIFNTGGGNSIIFQLGGSEKMRINTGTGNVGIGTSAPSYPLDVNGVIRTVSTFVAGTSLGSDQGLLLPRGGTIGDGPNAIGAFPGWNSNMLYVNVYSNAGSAVQSFSAGIEMHGNTTVIGAGTTCLIGTGTGATNCTSDIRLKTNIQPIPNALEKLSRINGVTFHWKDPSKTVPEHIGVIAQDVEKVFPQAVTTISDTTLKDAKAVDYAVLVAPMIEALKELKAENDNLRAENDNMRRDFERRLRALEKRR